MAKKNERTSARIAKIAGRILAVDPYSNEYRLQVRLSPGGAREWATFDWGDIRALAASCLTQTADKKWITRRNAASKRDDHRIGFSHWGKPPGEKAGPRRPRTVGKVMDAALRRSVKLVAKGRRKRSK